MTFFCFKEKTGSWQCEESLCLVACVLQYYLLLKEGKKRRQKASSATFANLKRQL